MIEQHNFVDALEKSLPVMERIAKLVTSHPNAFAISFSHERHVIQQMIDVSRKENISVDQRRRMEAALSDFVDHIDHILLDISMTGDLPPLKCSDEELQIIRTLRGTHEMMQPYDGRYDDIINTTTAVKMALKAAADKADIVRKDRGRGSEKA